MSAVGLAATTSIAGIFGMNLVSGIEEAPLAFAAVTLGSGLVGAAVIACVKNYLVPGALVDFHSGRRRLPRGNALPKKH